MRLKTSMLAGLLGLTLAAPAAADLTTTVTMSAGSPPANAIPVGTNFTVDVTLTTTTMGEARGVSMRLANWMEGDLTFVSATNPGVGGLTPNGSLFGQDLGGGFIVSAIGNQLVAPVVTSTGANPNVNLFQGLTLDPTFGAGPDTFTVTFTAVNEGSNTLEAGVLPAFLPGDAYVSAAGSGVNNGSLMITVVPEPAALAGSFAALGAVGLVSAVRRRRS